MSRPRKANTASKIQARIKEGRGQGTGENYDSWLKVQDFSSRGQSNRDLGYTTGRQHDYFSKLEHRYHLILDYSGLIDIREQYPCLPIEKTISIAKQCGIRHPADVKTKEFIVMTTDVLLTVPLPVGQVIVARTVKYSVDLLKDRVIEKLEIERRYWEEQGINWGIVTERDIDPVLVDNLIWLYKWRTLESLRPMADEVVWRVAQSLTEMVFEIDAGLSDIALECDDRLGLKPGHSLAIARYLIASRQWEVDLTKPIETRQRLLLLNASLEGYKERKTGT